MDRPRLDEREKRAFSAQREKTHWHSKGECGKTIAGFVRKRRNRLEAGTEQFNIDERCPVPYAAAHLLVDTSLLLGVSVSLFVNGKPPV
jgi:hypothetical protein